MIQIYLLLWHVSTPSSQLDNGLVHKNRRKYNVITQVLALKSHLMSPSYYRYLQSLDCLSLQQPKTLQQLYSKIGLESDFTTFLKQLTTDFTSKERNLVLHMDEIRHGAKPFGLKPFIDERQALFKAN